MEKTKEMAASIISLFENLLDKHGIDIPSKDRDSEIENMTEEEIKAAGLAHIYGEEYYSLENKIVELLSKQEDSLKENKIGQYWPSAIVQNDSDKKAWLLSTYDSKSSLNEAIETINRTKSNNRVLAAWVDTFDENDNKQTVFHECYVNAFGDVARRVNEMEGYCELTEEYWLDNLNYEDIILDGSDIAVDVLEDIMDELGISHVRRLYAIWDGKFYIENCDIQEVESREDFEFMLSDGYIVKKLCLKDNKLWIEN